MKLLPSEEHQIDVSKYHHAANTSDEDDTSDTSKVLIKSFSVRLGRRSEYFKETVQKVLIPKIPSHLSSVLNSFTVPPTLTHRFPERCINANRSDSLQIEMCHFKPIRTAPTTPWKSNSKSRGAALKIPKACLPTKVNYFNCDDEKEYVNFNFRPKPSSALSLKRYATPAHLSAFVCLVTAFNSGPVPQNDTHNTEPSPAKLSRKRATFSKSLKKRESESTGISPTIDKLLRQNRESLANTKNLVLDLPVEAALLKSNECAKSSSTGNSKAIKSRAKRSILKSQLKISQKKEPQQLRGMFKVTRRHITEHGLYEIERPTQRKSARLSKDCSTTKPTERKKMTHQQSSKQNKSLIHCFSPPLTRLRLRQMSNFHGT